MFWWLLAAVAILFCLSVLRGAPWLPTKSKQVETALELLDLAPGEKVVDLGSGSGGFLLAAARADLYATGYEINPLLCIWARVRTWAYRDRVRIVWGDFWLRPLPDTDGVYVFLIDHYMGKLEQKLEREAGDGMVLVSYIFKLPKRTPTSEHEGFYLYRYRG